MSAPQRDRGAMSPLERRLASFITPDRARIYSMLMVAVIFGGYLVSIGIGPLRSGGFTDAAGAVIGADYSAFYWAGHAVVHGRVDSLYDIEAQAEFLDVLIAPATDRGEVHAFVSPPYWALFFAPFGAMPYPVALTAFWLLSALLLVGMVRVLRAELPQLEALGSTARATALGLCFFPVLFSFLNGQTSMLLLAVWVGFFVLLRRGDDFTAGLVLGLLAVKPQIAFGPTLMLLAARRWRGLLGAALGASIWLIIGIVVMPGAMAEYLVVAPELFEFLRSDDYQTWGQTSLYGFGTLLLDPISHRLGGLVGNAFLVLAVVTNMVLVHRTPWTPGTPRWDLMMAGALTLGLLSSPHLFLYDVSLLALPLAILVARLDGECEGALLDGGPVLVASAVMAATVFFGPYLTLLEQNTMRDLGLPRMALQICSIAMLFFALRVWQRAFREGAAPSEPAPDPTSAAPAGTTH